MANNIPPVIADLLAGAALVASPAGEASAQPPPPSSGATSSDSIPRQWALRGVVVSESGRSAVLEHLPSGRQALVAQGGAVAPSVSVIAIDGEHVLLRDEGGATASLRLGHGGAARPPRARLVPRAPRARR